MTTEERTLPILPRLVRVDETEYWNLSEWPEVKAIYGHYFYDANEQTYCAEITPSRALYWVEAVPVFHDATADYERYEKIYDWIEEAARPDEYVTYVHCSDVDKLEGEAFDIDDIPYDDRSYRDQIDDWVHFCEGIPIPWRPL